MASEVAGRGSALLKLKLKEAVFVPEGRTEGNPQRCFDIFVKPGFTGKLWRWVVIQYSKEDI